MKTDACCTTLITQFTKEQIERPRTPAEFLAWFRPILDLTRHLPKYAHEQSLLQEGEIFKRLYQELYPLAMLLNAKRDSWQDVLLRIHFDRDSLDVEILSQELPFQWIEITCTTMDADIRFRYQIALSTGHVSVLRAPRHDSQGRTIGLSPFPREMTDTLEDIWDRLYDRILKKRKKNYDPAMKIALLLYYEDCPGSISNEYYDFVVSAIEATRDYWAAAFVQLFAVGSTGRLIEFSK